MAETEELTERMDVQDKNSLFREAREYLKGTGVYDHLVKTVVKLLEERPPDANALFEEISAGVRDTTVLPPAPLPQASDLPQDEPSPPSATLSAVSSSEPLPPSSNSASTQRQAVLSFTHSAMPLFERPTTDVPPAVCYPEELLDQAKLWEWGGVSFGTWARWRCPFECYAHPYPSSIDKTITTVFLFPAMGP